MENKLQRVHISYKHDKSYEEALEAIIKGLTKNQIDYSIDVIDIKYRDDIIEYEKEIGGADRVIMFITSAYLKSIDCMFEMTEIFKNQDVKERVFPVVDLMSIPRDREGLREIKDYWQKQKNETVDQIQTETGNSDYVIDELSKINAIIKVLDDFWYYIVHNNTGTFEKLIENDAELLMEDLKREVPSRKSILYDEKKVLKNEMQPSVIHNVIQKGEKSIYVEKNTGSITIN